MKPLASLAFGAIALATSIGFAEPAAARGNFGVYIGPGGVGISIDQYRDRCRDGWYSRHHWDHCSRYGNNYGYDNGYYNGYDNGYYGNGYRYNNDWNERNRHHRHNRHDRDDRRDHRDRDDDRRGW